MTAGADGATVSLAAAEPAPSVIAALRLLTEGGEEVRAAARRRAFLAPIGAGVNGDLPGLRAFEDYYFREKLYRERHWAHDYVTRTSYQAAHGSAWLVDEVYRGFGKTLLRSQIGVIYAVAFGLKRFVLICSPVSDIILGGIVEELTENKLLKRDFGESIAPAIDFKKQFKAFNDKQVVLKNGAVIRRQNPLEAIKGLKTPDGLRPDFIIFDDLLTDAEKNSPTIRERTWRWLNDGALPACAEFGRRTSVIITDAFKHKDAPASRKIREIVEKERAGVKTRWRYLKLGARDDQGRPVGMTERDLERMADLLDPIAMSREMFGKDVSSDQQLFWPDRWPSFDSRTWRRPEGPHGRRTVATVDLGKGPVDTEVTRSVLFIDPAAGSTAERITQAQAESADWFAMALVGRLAAKTSRKSPFLACPEIRASKATGGHYGPQLADIVAMALRYQPDEVLWETNGGQIFFLPQLKKALRDAGYRGRITGLTSRGPKPTRILSAKRELDACELFLGQLVPATLIEEAEAYRVWGSKEHDDQIEALTGAIRRLRDGMKGMAFGKERIRFGGGGR